MVPRVEKAKRNEEIKLNLLNGEKFFNNRARLITRLQNTAYYKHWSNGDKIEPIIS